MIVRKAKSSLILPSFLARVTMAPAQTRDIQYLGCWIHFSSTLSMIFCSFSVTIPASHRWDKVGNLFFT